MKETKAKPEPEKKDSAGVIASDEFAGQGGSYVFDPVTNTRKPAQSDNPNEAKD